MRMHRAFSMPNAATFQMGPVSDLLDRWLAGRRCVVDPFCGDSDRGHHRNDLRDGTDALEWLPRLKEQGVRATAVLLDPPYSPRQIAEHYRAAGRQPTTGDTQNARLYRLAREGLDALLEPGGIAISCGWSSTGFGEARGYELLELLLVHHGGAHHDTIVLVERKRHANINDRAAALRGRQFVLSGGISSKSVGPDVDAPEAPNK